MFGLIKACTLTISH